MIEASTSSHNSPIIAPQQNTTSTKLIDQPSSLEKNGIRKKSSVISGRKAKDGKVFRGDSRKMNEHGKMLTIKMKDCLLTRE
ncbi:hypothetical protein Tco_0931939 [Tanacetum coccineum]